MKRITGRYLWLFILVTAVILTTSSTTYAATGRQMAQQAIAAMQSSAPTTTVQSMTSLAWSWFEVSFQDETYPLTIDLVGSNFLSPKKVIYLLPGGGLNFRSSFFTPVGDNLTQFFRRAGYLVVSITPREDSVPSGGPLDCIAEWGMAKHKEDIHEIIEIIQGRLNLPYRILGHSFGAAYALDYAASYDGAEKIIALDIYSFGEGSDGALNSATTCGAYQELMGEGTYADTTFSDFKQLMFLSMLLPGLDSGEPREGLGCSGNFTLEGLLFFSLIYSSEVPGIHTDITGLPGDWPLVQSYAAGEYVCSDNPADDEYFLDLSDIVTLRTASFKMGSGLVPCAVYRDWYAVNAHNGVYEIDWGGIQEPVLWVNTGLGYGEQWYAPPENTEIERVVIDGYGHLDVFSNTTAQQDIWCLFLEP